MFIVKTSNGYEVRLNEDGLPQLRLSRHYRRLLSDGESTREVRSYVKERCNSALQLIKNIEQRKHTIVRVCESVIQRQTEFLEKGIDYLRPMMIKEVAEEVGVHPSTVSRAVANKYAHTPQGVYELRYFFSEEEDSAHPLTDEAIMQHLHQQGFNVTRRTVAKYREDMKIPSTHQRRVKG